MRYLFIVLVVVVPAQQYMISNGNSARTFGGFIAAVLAWVFVKLAVDGYRGVQKLEAEHRPQDERESSVR